MTLKIGIIGYGIMGKIRQKAINNLGIGEVIAISEPSIGTDFKLTPNLTHEEIIQHPAIDAIIICTPNYLNKELTIRAMDAGKHVFCEKPPAFNCNELNEIIKAEKISGKKLMYGFNLRHHGSIRLMKKIIDSNEYGKVLWIRGRYGKSVDKSFYDSWRAKKDLAGGGILLDQGIHMLDLFIMFGGEYDSVHADVSNLYWDLEVEDNVFAIYKNTKTGVVASLHSTMTQWRHLFSLEVFLEKGYFVLNGLKTTSGSYGDEILSIAKNRTTAPAATWEDEEHITFHENDSWSSEVNDFLNAIQNDTPIKVGNSSDALAVMKLIDETYKNGV